MSKDRLEGIPDQTIDAVDTASVARVILITSHDTGDATKIHHLWRSRPDLVGWAVGDQIKHVDEEPSIILDPDDFKTDPATNVKYYRLKAPFARVVKEDTTTLFTKKGELVEGIPDQTIDSVTPNYDAGGKGRVKLLKGIGTNNAVKLFYRPEAEYYARYDKIIHTPFSAQLFLDDTDYVDVANGGSTDRYKLLLHPFMCIPATEEPDFKQHAHVADNKSTIRFHGVKRQICVDSTLKGEKLTVTLVFPK